MDPTLDLDTAVPVDVYELALLGPHADVVPLAAAAALLSSGRIHSADNVLTGLTEPPANAPALERAVARATRGGIPVAELTGSAPVAAWREQAIVKLRGKGLLRDATSLRPTRQGRAAWRRARAELEARAVRGPEGDLAAVVLASGLTGLWTVNAATAYALGERLEGRRRGPRPGSVRWMNLHYGNGIANAGRYGGPKSIGSFRGFFRAGRDTQE